MHEPLGPGVLAGMAWWAEQEPKRVALIDGTARDRTYTYGELWDRAARVWRAAEGRAGECWALQGADGVALLVALMAAIGGGAVAALLDPTWPDGLRDEVMADLPAARRLNPEALWRAADAAGGGGRWPASVQPEMPFYVGVTSGSSGRPKAVLRAHRCWTASFAAGRELAPVAGERLVVLGPLYFSAPLFHLLHAWQHGATVHLLGSARQLSDALRRAQVAFLVPAWLRMLADLPRYPHGPSSLRVITVGEKLRPALRARLAERWPGWQIAEYYGASELGFVSLLTPADGATAPASVGRAFPGVQLRLCEGVLQVRSQMVALGYLQQGVINPIVDPEGWASAGDLAALDAEGLLYLRGRPDAVINRGGAKVYPVEVEAALLQHPLVAEAVVLAVPDPRRGQQVLAAIEPVPGQLLSAGELRRFLIARLPTGHRPGRYWIGPIPRTSAGKVDRQALLSAASLAQLPGQSAQLMNRPSPVVGPDRPRATGRDPGEPDGGSYSPSDP